MLAIKLHLYGALIALSIYQSIAFIATLFLCCRADWFKFSSLFGKIDFEITKKFSSFVLDGIGKCDLRAFIANVDSCLFKPGVWRGICRILGSDDPSKYRIPDAGYNNIGGLLLAALIRAQRCLKKLRKKSI